MNLALWRKAVSDAWLQLLLSSLLLVLFGWAFVWLMSRIPIDAFSMILRWMPSFIESLLPVPIGQLATRPGQLSVAFVHVVPLLVCVGWAVGRGSDSISGEIGRGTMDLLLSLPVRRVSVMAAPAAVATLGAAVLAASLWLGLVLGVWTTGLDDKVSVGQLLPGALNLSAMVFCLTGLTTFVSSWNRDRWRTIALSVGFYVVSFLIEIVGRLWQATAWLKYCTFLSAFQPQKLILAPDAGAWLPWQCNGALLGLGLLCYVAAGVVLSRRDIPTAL
jgi:ABC-2 type transport system permease protein